MLAIFFLSKHIPNYKNEEPVSFKKQLSFVRNPNIMLSLIITFFWICGYAVLYSYITPFLKTTALMNDQILSFTFLMFGIATLIGNKFGGFLSDKIGFSKTLLISMLTNFISLLLLSVFAESIYVTILILFIWAIASWAPGPNLRYSVIEHATESQGIVLSLFNSTIQLGFAIGAGFGGIVIEKFPIIGLSYTAAISIAISLIFSLIYYLFFTRKKIIV